MMKQGHVERVLDCCTPLDEHLGEERRDGFDEHGGRRTQQDDGREVERTRGVDRRAAPRKRDLGRIGHNDHQGEQEYLGESLEREIAHQQRKEEEAGGDERKVVDLEAERRVSELTLQVT
jgi:hypothetical protein